MLDVLFKGLRFSYLTNDFKLKCEGNSVVGRGQWIRNMKGWSKGYSMIYYMSGLEKLDKIP